MPGFLFRPKWIAFHLLVAAVVVLMINLGFWQLRRLDERKDANSVLVARIEQTPVPLASILDDPGFDPAVAENRRVTATGTYFADQVVVFNRSQDGRAVDNVLTPLALDDGRVVLVNRGAIAIEAPPPAPPAVEVSVLGRLRESEVRQRGGLTDSASGPLTEVRRVDLDALAPQFGGDLVPMYLELISSEPAAGPGDPAVLNTPTLSEGNHLSYAVQWFIFSVCVFIGWVLAVRRSLAAHAKATAGVSADGAAGPAGPDSPPPAADESATTPI